MQGLWSSRKARELSETHGVNERTIWKDRLWVLGAWKSDLDLTAGDRRQAKADLLNRARGLYQQAVERGHTMTAARLLSFEAQVLGAFEPVEVSHVHRVARMEDEELARMLLDPDARAWAEQVVQASEARNGQARQLTDKGGQVVLDAEFETVKEATNDSKNDQK